MPGAPIIYGGSPACFDMRKGTTPMGAVETMMIDGAYAEIGKHLGLPVQAYMALSDSKTVDYQAGMETAMGADRSRRSPASTTSPAPACSTSSRARASRSSSSTTRSAAWRSGSSSGIELRDDPIVPLDLMREGIERKSFLSLAHTMKWFRKEVYYPRRGDRPQRPRRVAEAGVEGRRAARDRARREDTRGAHARAARSGRARAPHGAHAAEAKRFGMKELPSRDRAERYTMKRTRIESGLFRYQARFAAPT